MHSTSILGLLKEFQRQNLQNLQNLWLRLRPWAVDLIIQNENFGLGLMPKIRLQSYSAPHPDFQTFLLPLTMQVQDEP